MFLYLIWVYYMGRPSEVDARQAWAFSAVLSNPQSQLNSTDESQYHFNPKSEHKDHPFCFVMYGLARVLTPGFPFEALVLH